jgi:hypothetical protein
MKLSRPCHSRLPMLVLKGWVWVSSHRPACRHWSPYQHRQSSILCCINTIGVITGWHASCTVVLSCRPPSLPAFTAWLPSLLCPALPPTVCLLGHTLYPCAGKVENTERFLRIALYQGKKGKLKVSQESRGEGDNRRWRGKGRGALEPTASSHGCCHVAGAKSEACHGWPLTILMGYLSSSSTLHLHVVVAWM